MSDENGNGSVQTSAQSSEIVDKGRVKVISDKARTRVEELINDKTKDLKHYLDNLKQHAHSAVDALPFTQKEQVFDLKLKKNSIQGDRERIGVKKLEKVTAVEKILEKQYKEKLARLERLSSQVRERWEKSKQAAKLEIELEFKEKELELVKQVEELESSISDLERNYRGEKLVRKAALDHTFSKMEVEIADRRNSAVRTLWTTVETTKDAGGALDMLPDAQTFREHVTPELFLGIFNDFLGGKTLSNDLKCKYCGSKDITVDATYGYMVCGGCSKRDVVDVKSAVQPLQIPNLVDIIKQSTYKAQADMPKMIESRITPAEIL